MPCCTPELCKMLLLYPFETLLLEHQFRAQCSADNHSMWAADDKRSALIAAAASCHGHVTCVWCDAILYIQFQLQVFALPPEVRMSFSISGVQRIAAWTPVSQDHWRCHGQLPVSVQSVRAARSKHQLCQAILQSDLASGLSAEDIQEEFSSLCTTVAHSGKLGIFSMECAHRLTQTCVNASKSLGRPKSFDTISAESLLTQMKQRHHRHGATMLSDMYRRIVLLIFDLEFGLAYSLLPHIGYAHEAYDHDMSVHCLASQQSNYQTK